MRTCQSAVYGPVLEHCTVPMCPGAVDGLGTGAVDKCVRSPVR
jgi:hypothetical protein